MSPVVVVKNSKSSSCGRCDKLRNFMEPKLSSGKFYCDNGKRAVMRRLRQEILKDLNWSVKDWMTITENENLLAD